MACMTKKWTIPLLNKKQTNKPANSHVCGYFVFFPYLAPSTYVYRLVMSFHHREVTSTTHLHIPITLRPSLGIQPSQASRTIMQHHVGKHVAVDAKMALTSPALIPPTFTRLLLLAIVVVSPRAVGFGLFFCCLAILLCFTWWIAKGC